MSPAQAARPSPGDLGLGSRLAYHAAVGSDYALRTALATALSSSLVPAALRPAGRRERERLEFYAELAESGDPGVVFQPPERVEVMATAGRDLGVAHGRVEVLRFVSPYVALNPDVRRDYAGHANNATADRASASLLAQYRTEAEVRPPPPKVMWRFGARVMSNSS